VPLTLRRDCANSLEAVKRERRERAGLRNEDHDRHDVQRHSALQATVPHPE
jgi:hypothetical protein